jgi:hypothetical protein
MRAWHEKLKGRRKRRIDRRKWHRESQMATGVWRNKESIDKANIGHSAKETR